MHDEHQTNYVASRTVDDRVRALAPPVHAAVVRTGSAQAHEEHPGMHPAVGECDGLTGMARQMCHAFL